MVAHGAQVCVQLGHIRWGVRVRVLCLSLSLWSRLLVCFQFSSFSLALFEPGLGRRRLCCLFLSRRRRRCGPWFSPVWCSLVPPGSVWCGVPGVVVVVVVVQFGCRFAVRLADIILRGLASVPPASLGYSWDVLAFRPPRLRR